MDPRISKFIADAPSNNECADCGEKGTRWVSVTFGVFLCIRCGGIHRKLGTHISRIKSLYLDILTDEQIENILSCGGNAVMNNRLNGLNIPPPFTPDRVDCYNEAEMEQYIRDKYQRKVFNISSNNSLSVSTASYTDSPNLMAVLQDMGFSDKNSCADAILTSNGDLSVAIEILLNQKESLVIDTSYSNRNISNKSSSCLETQSSPISTDFTFEFGPPASSNAFTPFVAHSHQNQGDDIFKLHESINILEGMGFKNKHVRNHLNLADSYLGAALIYNNLDLEATINELVNNEKTAKHPPQNNGLVLAQTDKFDLPQNVGSSKLNLLEASLYENSFSSEDSISTKTTSNETNIYKVNDYGLTGLDYSRYSQPYTADNSNFSTSNNPIRRNGPQSINPPSKILQNETAGIWKSDFGSNNVQQFEFGEFVSPRTGSHKGLSISNNNIFIEHTPLKREILTDKNRDSTPSLEKPPEQLYPRNIPISRLKADNDSTIISSATLPTDPGIQFVTDSISDLNLSAKNIVCDNNFAGIKHHTKTSPVKQQTTVNLEDKDPFAELINL